LFTYSPCVDYVTTQSPTYNRPHAIDKIVLPLTLTDTHCDRHPLTRSTPLPTSPQGCPCTPVSAGFVVQYAWLVSALRRLYSTRKAYLIEIELCLAYIAISVVSIVAKVFNFRLRFDNHLITNNKLSYCLLPFTAPAVTLVWNVCHVCGDLHMTASISLVL